MAELRTFHEGEPPPTATELNEIVRRASREVRGTNVYSDPTGWNIVNRRVVKGRTHGKIVCAGPDGQANPTNQTYWVQFTDYPGAVDGDPNFPLEFDVDANDIVLATNSAEADTGTHSLRVGTIVELFQVEDQGGTARWVFSMATALLITLMGGYFSAYGQGGLEGLGFYSVDSWDASVTPARNFNASNQDVQSPADYAYFQGTHWIVGSFSPIDPAAGAAGMAYWDHGTQLWVGVDIQSGVDNVGVALYVWKTSTGERLFVSSRSPQHVKEVQFDPVTNVVTMVDIGWNTEMGVTALPANMIAFDDGQGSSPREHLYFFGVGWTTGSPIGLKRMAEDGTFSDIGGVGTGENIREAVIHDFRDGLGPRLVVIGWFSTMNGVSAQNVAAWDPVAVNWEEVGGGLAGSSGSFWSIGSFAGRLWAGANTTVGGAASQLMTLAEGAPADTVWAEAHSIIKNLSDGGLWRWQSTGGGGKSRKEAQLFTMLVHNRTLVIGGTFTYREGNRFANSGPIAAWDGTSTISPLAPAISGAVRALAPWDGGLVVAGDITATIASVPGTPSHTVNGLALWRDGTSGDINDGTWISMGTVVGTIFAVAEFNGSLYVGGDLVSIDGVAVNGLARWDGSSWRRVSNFSDYGTIHALATDGESLFIGGDFIKADGKPSLKIGCKLGSDHSTLTSIFTDITAADGAPEINAFYVNGGFLYTVGWFADIDDGFGAVTMNSVTRLVIATGDWETLPDSFDPSIGLTAGHRAYTCGYEDGLFYIGADTDTEISSSGSDAVWVWDAADAGETWSGAGVGGLYSSGPCKAIGTNVGETKVYEAITQTGGTLGQEYSVYEDDGSIRIGPPAHSFNAPVLAICSCNAGSGERVFMAGGFSASGADDAGIVSEPAQLMVGISEDLDLIDVAGGAGTTSVLPEFVLGGNLVTRLREYDIASQDVNKLYVVTQATGVTRTVGPIQALKIRGLAHDDTGEILYGITDEWLFTTSKLQGTHTLIGHTSTSPMGGLAFDDPHAIMYATLAGNLITIDTTNGRGEIIGSMGLGPITMTGLAYQASDEALFGTDGERLYQIDVSNGVAGLIGETGFKNLSGLASKAGVLLAVNLDTNKIVTIDSSTAGSVESGVAISTASMATLAWDGTNLFSATTGVGVGCKHLIACGSFSNTSQGYSNFIAGVNTKGKIVGLNGGLYGSSNVAQVGVDDSKPVAWDRWPAYFVDEVFTECQPWDGFAWIIAGNFNRFYNNSVSGADAGTIANQGTVSDGVVAYMGGRFYRLTSAGHGMSTRSVEIYDKKIVIVGGGRSPLWWNGTLNSGTWDALAVPIVAGSLPDGVSIAVQFCLTFGSNLLIAGQVAVNPISSTSKYYGLATWNGSYGLGGPWTAVSTDDIVADGNLRKPKGHVLTSGYLNGTTEVVLIGGRGSHQDDSDGVVFQSPDGTSWSEVGSTLSGECKSLAIVEHPNGNYILAGGDLKVSGASCDVAMFRSGAWTRVGFLSGTSKIERNRIASGHHGRQACETGPFGPGAVLGGDFVDISSTVGGDPIQAPAMARFTPEGLMEQFPGLGLNAPLRSIVTAGHLVYPSDRSAV